PSPANPANPGQPGQPAQPGQPGAPAANYGGGTVTIPATYSGGAKILSVDHPRPLEPTPKPPPPAPPQPPPPPQNAPDAFRGVAPDVDIISIRQTSAAFGLKDPYTGDEDPQTVQKIDSVETMARAVVHAANMGAQVINISSVTCMSARNVVDQRALGAALR